ncbi:type II toxin-antitoxin system YafQ family toxin [Bifidobacterium sp. ESL0775]|uniref:type II toxin-antitoxin system RelE/ParE family toxin n=1 Tax=Bifidobacterium sp. ESL0775 TaxID=2983230 RepID=UPI0023F9A9BD|nr:type II toxin-antitoxin system YafQ family toxin [Bifidobacterium sp. ESL0775]WEV69132.1 type II toxin-antitoxin system YafQ family toxin [Bifidobacterium sp. ESL0775]
MYEFEYTGKFIKDVKRLKKKHYDLRKLYRVLDDLRVYDLSQLTRQYRDHQLKGNYRGYHELHIEGDWLLVYRREKKRLVLTLMSTSGHDDTF